MTRREWFALAGAGTFLKADINESILGEGWGLDHFLIALADPGLVQSIFVAKLGFTAFAGGIKTPTGDQNAVIRLGPQYIELIWFYDRQKAILFGDKFSKQWLHTVDQGGGPVGYVIDVSPLERAASELKKRGMHVELPPSRTILRDGKEVAPDYRFLEISDTESGRSPRGIPGGDAAGFIDYGTEFQQRGLDPARTQRHRDRAEKEFPDPRRRSGEVHPNTARRIRSAWVAVASVPEALKRCEAFGFAGGRDVQSKTLGARGHEVPCGLGTLVFWESAKAEAPLATVIRSKGVGPFGVSVDVADLELAHKMVSEGLNQRLPLEDVGSRKSFLVPAGLTGGTWIEFGEQTR
jgi:hypothetical protein